MLPVYICEDDPVIRAFQEDYLKKREIRMNNGETCLFSRSVKGALLSRI